jgi:tRNA modification GTPase
VEEILALKRKVEEETGPEKLLIILANKCDHPSFGSQKFERGFDSDDHVMTISAKEKTHLDQLRSLLIHHINLGQINSGDTIVTNLRHYDALTKAQGSLQEVLNRHQPRLRMIFSEVLYRKVIYFLLFVKCLFLLSFSTLFFLFFVAQLYFFTYICCPVVAQLAILLPTYQFDGSQAK